MSALALKYQTVSDEECEPNRFQCKQRRQCGDTAITGLAFNRLHLWLMRNSLTGGQKQETLTSPGAQYLRSALWTCC